MFGSPESLQRNYNATQAQALNSLQYIAQLRTVAWWDGSDVLNAHYLRFKTVTLKFLEPLILNLWTILNCTAMCCTAVQFILNPFTFLNIKTLLQHPHQHQHVQCNVLRGAPCKHSLWHLAGRISLACNYCTFPPFKNKTICNIIANIILKHHLALPCQNIVTL